MKPVPQFGRTILRLNGKHCYVWMDARPPYCDRGRVLLHVEVEANRLKPWVDAADGFPRYYFDVERAKAEAEAWLRARDAFIDDQWIEEIA